MAEQKTTKSTKPKTIAEKSATGNKMKNEDVLGFEIDLKSTTSNMKIEDSVIVDVRSNCVGELIYIDKYNDRVSWSNYDDIQPMTFGELRNMRMSKPDYFRKRLIILLGVSTNSDCEATPADIYKALNVTQYYENIITPRNIKSLIRLSNNEIAERVSLLDSASKEALILAVANAISTRELDSMQKIDVFEKELGVVFDRK